MTTELKCVCGQQMTQTAVGSLPTWNCPACGYTAIEYNIGSGAYGWHAPKSYTYDWQVRRFWRGRYEYTVRCVVCGNRHKLKAVDTRDNHDTVKRRYTLTKHPGSIEASWSQSELDAMAAENG